MKNNKTNNKSYRKKYKYDKNKIRKIKCNVDK